jgi:inhibitor of KinA sporulation pathway (predicted exonuclease)
MVIDLEATCWEGEPPKYQSMEPIEIGVCLMEVAPDNQWEITDHFGILIKPTRSYVSQFCQDLTGITQKALEDNGISFGEAMQSIQDIRTNVWASWGMWDYDALKKECGIHGLKMWKYLPTLHLNVKSLYSALYRRKRCGVQKAISLLGMGFEGRPHRGEDDAVNIAKILQHMLNGG